MTAATGPTLYGLRTEPTGLAAAYRPMSRLSYPPRTGRPSRDQAIQISHLHRHVLYVCESDPSQSVWLRPFGPPTGELHELR